jgi:hypothetical protein
MASLAEGGRVDPYGMGRNCAALACGACSLLPPDMMMPASPPAPVPAHAPPLVPVLGSVPPTPPPLLCSASNYIYPST